MQSLYGANDDRGIFGGNSMMIVLGNNYITQ